MATLTRYKVTGWEPGPYPKAPTAEWRVLKAIADMLRYDGATVEKIEFIQSKRVEHKRVFIATCKCFSYPEDARWRSFGYSTEIIEHEDRVSAKDASEFCNVNIRRAKQLLGYPESQL